MSLAADRAYERIRAGILSGEFAPASRLKEEELVRVCGVSRTPVREALGRLAAEDYVIVVRNQGAQVKTWSDEDMADLFDLRALLEGHAAARAARLIDSAGLRFLQDNIEQMERVFESHASDQQKTETFLRLNGQLHEAIWKAAGSERLESCWCGSSIRRWWCAPRTSSPWTGSRSPISTIATSSKRWPTVIRCGRRRSCGAIFGRRWCSSGNMPPGLHPPTGIVYNRSTNRP